VSPVFDLKGRAVVVTGGGRGIGRGITRAMAKAGANVVVAGRTPEPLRAAAVEARGFGVDAIDVPADVTDPDAVASVVARTLDEFGGVDCWVNNAGGTGPENTSPLLELTEAQWDAVVGLNMKATFFAAQAAARAMTRGGAIVNISSRSGAQPNPMSGQYGASKAGIDNLTATMAVEWGHLGIRVNAVAPGPVLTEEPIAALDRPSRRLRQMETTPLRRLGTADDIGALCVFLASDEAAWLTGEVIQINGGSRIPVGYLTYLHHVNERLGWEHEA